MDTWVVSTSWLWCVANAAINMAEVSLTCWPHVFWMHVQQCDSQAEVPFSISWGAFILAPKTAILIPVPARVRGLPLLYTLPTLFSLSSCHLILAAARCHLHCGSCLPSPEISDGEHLVTQLLAICMFFWEMPLCLCLF